VPKPPSEKHACLTSDLCLESKLGPWKHANGHIRVVYRDKAARDGMREAADTNSSPTLAGRDTTSSKL